MTDDAGSSVLKPTLLSAGPFNIIGCAGEFQPGATPEISGLWAEFAPRMTEIQNRRGIATFGLSLMPESNNTEPAVFTYLAGVDADSLDVVPAGMVGHHLPASEYAIFAYDGGIGPELQKTLKRIFEQWLPDSPYIQDGVDFEYYDERFDPMTGQGTFFIYVPVRRAQN